MDHEMLGIPIIKKKEKKKNKKKNKKEVINAPSTLLLNKEPKYIRDGLDYKKTKDRSMQYVRASFLIKELESQESILDKNRIFIQYSVNDFRMACSILEIEGRSKLTRKQELYSSLSYHLIGTIY